MVNLHQKQKTRGIYEGVAALKEQHITLVFVLLD